MKYFHIQKRHLYLGASVFFAGLIILFFAKPEANNPNMELALGIFGAGFAAFTGAYAAFMFEKSEKIAKEKQYLLLALFYLGKMYERNPDHIKMIVNLYFNPISKLPKTT